jgi:hypothetical protein
MDKRVVREILFFVLLATIFYMAMNGTQILLNSTKWKKEIVYICMSVIYTLCILAVYFFGKVNRTNENFWDISDYAKCKGGPYMWQGDSPEAKKCRQLATTKEGRCGIASYNCPKSYVGTPKIPFYYTPLSNDSWKNERCAKVPACPCSDQGLCNLDRQVPF